MLPHSYYQETVGKQIPIKNDWDSQALPSDDDWETGRNQNRNFQQNQQTSNPYQNQISGGVTTPQYLSSYQQRNFQNPSGLSQRVVNDPFPSVNDQFNPIYKGTSGNPQQVDPYYQQQQQQMPARSGSRNQMSSQMNPNSNFNNDQFDSPIKTNTQKKSTLIIQNNPYNNQPQKQYEQPNNSPYQGMYGGNQEDNYGNPLGTYAIANSRNPQQSYKTENVQFQEQQSQQKNMGNNQYSQQQQQQQQQQNQQNQQQQQQQYERTLINTTINDNYNENSPMRDINITNTGYNMVNNTYADQPLVTPPKQRKDFVDLINKQDLNISNNIITNQNPNSNNINNNNTLQQHLEANQNKNIKSQQEQINPQYQGFVDEGLKDRNSTNQQWRETSQYDGANSHIRSASNIHNRGNYSGMYTYQIDNKNQSTVAAPAHLLFEQNKKQLYDQDGKIVNVDDPYFHDNFDLQQFNITQQLNTKKLTPLEISYLKKAQKILNTEYFYDKLPINYKSFIVPDDKRPLFRYFILEFFIPIITVFLLHVFLWGVQIGINDYCFQSSTFCKCENFSINLWTFFRQLISWKLGVISCKNLLLIEVGEERHPYMESFLMYLVGIGIDFVMVVGIGLNDDWQFYAMIFVVGYVLTIHTIKFKQFTHINSKGKGLLLYDLNLAAIIVFIYYALPAIYKSLIQRSDYQEGRNTFLYLYPLLEWVFELFTNFVLERAQLASFFQYQMYLLILGMKVGIMTSVSSNTFEFWYLGALFLLKRILESTNILYINIRKLFYRLFPQNLKYLISMGELPNYRKGREGFYLESIVWLGMYYWWYYTESIVPGLVKKYILVDNCEFKATNIFRGVTWDRPFFTWIFLFGSIVISLILNSNLRIDMIKWVGSPKHNFLENVFTRMFGWYLFQIAIIVSYSISQEYTKTYTNF